eukprot:Unigene8014_Nuclearia_a/m.24601 Unigene8014_Nuclearia_a/g.24601  ORF Unigene8014_Nuclearia_a/g.24601 Unigene8014_Nuclearia_a/m.24601 type:complete len:261 (-) Unigene8014_Nuclearia_a:56-838(-)
MTARTALVVLAAAAVLAAPGARAGVWSNNARGECLHMGDDAYPADAIQTQPDVFYSRAMIQKPAPPFEATAVINGEFKTIKLSDYRGKYVVLLFYPQDFTFVCPTELIAFSDMSSEFRALNTEVIGISVDSHFVHLAWINMPRAQGGLGHMEIPLVADQNRRIARDYGVLLEDDGFALRGLFIIDPKGVLRQITVNDIPVGRSVEETLRLIQAFQFNDVHGEVCPAGWKPGSQTIKPNPKEKILYFQNANPAAADGAQKS